jgi:peptidyl-dipeptidase Dcp
MMSSGAADFSGGGNPCLILESSNPFQAIPFDRIRDEDFEPAFELALQDARKKISIIRDASSDPTVETVLISLEQSTEWVDHLGSLFSNQLSANTNESLQKLAQKVMPELAAFSNDIHLDAVLFGRVKALWGEREALSLDSETGKLLEKTYRAFVRNGALLGEQGKERLRAIDQRLALVQQQYSDHVLAETNTFEMHIAHEADLAGLPPRVREAAAQSARERGKTDGWVFTLHQPSLFPFLQYSERRDLREKLWRAANARGLSEKNDNRPLVLEIVKLRQERARVLGFATHADFVLEERMASSPTNVRDFLGKLIQVSRPAAERDLYELKNEAGHDIQPWDVAFWSERLRRKLFDLDEDKLRAYFPLERVIEGVFEHARRLYGLEFKKRQDVPVYHSDVVAYEVTDTSDGSFIGLLYADFYPRASKRAGAWMTSYREQGLWGSEVKRPHIAIVCNLTKPSGGGPSLLSLDEVRTVFHEFGHALHGLLSKCRYRSLAGTNVYWDFVELPSQIMENWVRERESLALFARHYSTGELIPQELVEKVQASSKFQSGWFSLRQLNFAWLDLEWHGTDVSGVSDVQGFEARATEPTRLFPVITGTSVSAQFSHIFSGGYSAGYYSYKWAEVLDADAFEFFKEKGIFNREVSMRFRREILERGGTEHPMDLYVRFRGREPDPDALLKREGLL